MPPAVNCCPRCGTELPAGEVSRLCDRCQPPTAVGKTVPPTPGTVTPQGQPSKIGGYDILSIAGEGGMGTVYLARDPVLCRDVALKVLRPDVYSAEFAERLSDEAVVTGRLAHPGIVPVHQLGIDPTWGPWYTMKLVQGRPLSDILEGLRDRKSRDEEAWPLNALLGVFARVCEAIAFAHFNDVVHRDLKPGNIMLGEFGEALVLDWGLARVMGEKRKRAETTQIVAPAAGGLTRDGIIVGTPGYMSPEQAAGMGTMVGPPSDVYSLGTILYEIITLHPPVDTGDPDEAIRATLKGEITPVHKRGQGRFAPRALCQIVEHAMEADPAKRYPTARELARAVDEFLAGRVPWRDVAEGKGAEAWDLVSGRWSRRGRDLVCAGGQSARVVAVPRVTGDVRLEFTLSADVDRTSWEASVWLALRGGFSLEGYQIRLAAGADGRVELIRHGVAAARRLDVRLAARTRYRILVLREGDRITLTINGTRAVVYRDLFPLRGDRVGFSCDEEGVAFRDLKFEGRGAPLQLTFLALPDKLYQLGKMQEARDLYREMGETHPDREEGLLAHYKGALCSIEMGERLEALEALRKLDGTPLEAVIPLGQAKLELKAGNKYEAVVALQEGCQRYPGDPVRIELWTLLLETIDKVERESPDKASSMYQELLRQRWLDATEAAQVCAEMLRLCGVIGGPARVRDEAARQLMREKFAVEVRMECHAALARSGMTPDLIARCRMELQETLALGVNLAARDRWLTMLRLSETQLAEGDLRAARASLTVVMGGAAHPSNEGAWARNWLGLVALLDGNPDEALSILERESAAYVASKSLQELFRVLLECAALSSMNRAEDAITRLAETVAAVPEWSPVAGVIAGSEPLEALWSFAATLSPNLAAELYLLMAEVFAGRRQLSKATQLRARAIQVGAGRALALFLVSRRASR
jgi:tetratricopeptide (TPR) repeat protein